MKLGALVLGKTPLLCAVVAGKVESRSVNRALKAGADLLEIRLDTFTPIDNEKVVKSLKRLRDRAVPLLLTVRSAKEGGQEKISARDRLRLYRDFMPFVDAVDIELSSGAIINNVVEEAKKNSKLVLVSYHNFKSAPKAFTLTDIIKRARDKGADIIKIAVMVKKQSDLKTLASLLLSNNDLIVIGMGAGYGSASRVFFPALGSLITYASVSGTNAPGQLPLNAISRELKFFGLK